ncbi:pyruvate dehydrogenase E1 component subunit alpha-3, chloroplastic [Ananas comosus]|uniref:Pyruvate dehydrogenase E1 component subunit alpha n=1 Tax=Ananas comosus TaxID=4615 RepID=A0A199VC71_ANACO|nr:pyruvate dehydrogenase E1 component subunit alpha-3, chloroplastic [Ananas comosus]OAY74608.1 Pyruvate dehydrogenase E1 component subunit alpha-3, chloroplastic [Ananas comosus]
MSAFSAVKILHAHPSLAVRSSAAESSSNKPKPSFPSSPSSPFNSTNPSSSSSSLSSSPLRGNRRRPILAVSSDVVSKKQQQRPPLVATPAVTREESLELYEDMILGRTFEDMCAQMYYRGKMFGFVHLYNGQEAVSTGFIKLLSRADSVVSTYRDHVHALSKGVPARAVMAELFGKATGCCRGQGGSMHMFSAEHNLLGGFAFIGEGIPVATGAAFTSKYRYEVLKESNPNGLDVTLAFFGDGTCNNGQFFECLNMAQLWKLPIVFVVENNLWAIGMSHLRSTSDPEIWKKGPAFGMPGVHVDGMDVLKVREVAKEAIERARRGEGPTLVECETYRFRGHSLADPDELRKPDEKAHYATRDPITALKKYILEHNLASESELKTIEKKIDDEIEEAVEFADSSPHPPRSQLLENVFADPKGFGIGPDGKYRCEDPKFTQGTAQV